MIFGLGIEGGRQVDVWTIAICFCLYNACEFIEPNELASLYVKHDKVI